MYVEFGSRSRLRWEILPDDGDRASVSESLGMTIAVEKKAGIIEQHRLHGSDTGSPEIQIALLTTRIQSLTEHLKSNKKDHSSRRGLLKMVGRRSSLLKFLSGSDRDRYKKVVNSLGLRK